MFRRAARNAVRRWDARNLSLRLGEELVFHRKTVATAESITAGRISSLISMAPGASRYLVGGDVVYNIDQKVWKLGVDRALADSCNCVSESVVRQMAWGALARNHANIGIASTGYADAYPSERVTDPYAWIAVNIDGTGTTYKVVGQRSMTRTEMQDYIARESVRMLLHLLRK